MMGVVKNNAIPVTSAGVTARNETPIAAEVGLFRVRGWIYAGYVDDPRMGIRPGNTEVAVLVGTAPNQGSSIFQVLTTIKATGVLPRIDEKLQSVLAPDRLHGSSFDVHARRTTPTRILLFARNVEADPRYWWIHNDGDFEHPDLRMIRPPIATTAVMAATFNLDLGRVLRHVRQAQRRLQNTNAADVRERVSGGY
jgi:hypothetical protein